MLRIKANTALQTISGANGQTIICWNTTSGDLKIILFISDKDTLYAIFAGDTFPMLDVYTNVLDTISSFKIKLKDYVLYPVIITGGKKYYRNSLNNGFYVVNNSEGTDISIYTKDEVYDIVKEVIYGN